eukprot:TRINITY_DN759_c2_g1_i1.p1 TRINITY_DN759_c2_g1~~TRINITY_DN759_c2_g1_i1.p1  ORF type:complete len:754 (+),score=267.50 TRINITY_DN759_c2_g1_i1:109-2262(+)
MSAARGDCVMDFTQYEEILRPLRELEQVWGIDLAALLQRYASEVATITYEFGTQSLNFAQAAVLIMGASGIYSKKIDALQELVQDTLHLIINKGKRVDDGKDAGKRRRRRVVVRDPVQFTEEATALNILPAEKRVRSDVADALRSMLAGGGDAGRLFGSGDARVAEGELIPFEDVQTGSVHYRLSVCTLATEGLLLPNVRQELAGEVRLEPIDTLCAGDRRDVRMPPTPALPTHLSNRRVSLVERNPNNDDQAPERLDLDGFDKVLDEDAAAAYDNGNCGDDDDSTQHAGPRASEHHAQQQNQEAEVEEEDEEDEYYALLRAWHVDRFSASVPEKAYAQYTIKGDIKAPDPTRAILANLLADKMLSSRSEKLRHLNDRGEVVWDNHRMSRLAPAVYLDLTEVIRQAKDGAKARASKNRRLERWLERQRVEEREAEQLEHRDKDGAGEGGSDDGTMDDDGAEGGAADFGCQADAVSQRDAQMGTDDCGGNPPPGGAYGDFTAGDWDTAEEREFYASLAEYDDLLFERNYAATEKQANLSREEAQLHGRIALWSQRIEPLIEEQMARGHYDIYRYAQAILDQFAHEGETLHFDKIAKLCRGTWELSRYFLAMLQLSNNGNLHVNVNRLFDGARSDDISLRLLTRRAAFAFDAEDADEAFARGNAVAQSQVPLPVPSQQPAPSQPQAPSQSQVRPQPLQRGGRRKRKARTQDEVLSVQSP